MSELDPLSGFERELRVALGDELYRALDMRWRLDWISTAELHAVERAGDPVSKAKALLARVVLRELNDRKQRCGNCAHLRKHAGRCALGYVITQSTVIDCPGYAERVAY